MLTFNINSQTLGTVVFDSALPVEDFKTKEVKTDENGIPVYRINCLVRQDGSRQSTNLAVKVAAKENPENVIAPYQPIEFENMTALVWENGDKAGVSFSADRFRLTNPSEKASTKKD